jgi:hypothetical protein
MIRYYTEVLPSVSTYYSVRGLNAARYGALLRLLGGAIDVSPLVHAPETVVPITVLLSLFALAALVRLAPARAPIATFVLLPTAWYYPVVLALRTISELLRVLRLRARDAGGRRGPLGAAAAGQLPGGTEREAADGSPPGTSAGGGMLGLVALSQRAAGEES